MEETRLPSRIVYEAPGRSFRPLDNEEMHSHLCGTTRGLTHLSCLPDCRLRVLRPPVILHQIKINDLCGRDEALWTRVSYSDGVHRAYAECHAMQERARSRDPRWHPGNYPYALAELAYEAWQDAARTRVHAEVRRLRVRIDDPSVQSAEAFLLAAEELELPPETLWEIIRFHANPVVTIALRHHIA